MKVGSEAMYALTRAARYPQQLLKFSLALMSNANGAAVAYGRNPFQLAEPQEHRAVQLHVTLWTGPHTKDWLW